MTISNPEVVRAARATLVTVGARRSTVTVRFGSGLVGVTSALPLLRVTTNPKVPATVPVENATSGAPLKLLLVLFAGIVKPTLRPPVANCTAGSSLGTSAVGVKVKTSSPVKGTAVAAVRSTPTLGCCAGATTSVNPVNVTPEASPVPESENVRVPTVRLAVAEPGVVGRNVRFRSRLPAAGIVAGSVGKVPSVNSELLEVMVETLAEPLLGFTIWSWAELLPPAATD
jgi:hypothetical protein